MLGPFEVVDDERSLALGGPKQRALLAVLLLHRREVVLSDRLIDELWGGRPPATAGKTLRVYVSNLRKALGDGVLATRGRGYVLAPVPDQVDLDRFERLAAEGRDLLERGAARAARERLRGALALWRGSALADFSYEPFAESEITRLEEARLAALEDRIDADLALGSDGALISELESLVASHPLQERMRGQLMRALYRAGRQADALAVYRQTRERLREDLGLEPSRMLQDLERSILEQDPSLDVGPPRASAVGVCPFKGLAFFDRGDAEYFFGRERLVTELVARLAESTLAGVLGPSGIGKSSLLRAGVLPALSAGALPGSAQWRQVLIRPGEHPSRAVDRALFGCRLIDALEQVPPGGRIVVAVDQFEELFTLCQDEKEREAFLDELVAAAGDPERRAIVLVSLRADFYGRLASYPSFGERLTGCHVLVGPMDRDELTRAVEQPAARAGLQLERGLADGLVSDVLGEAGGLPLLSTTLLELWRAREGPALRYDSYRRSGGVRGAVARLAEDAYTRLGESERRTARRVMLRLAAGDGAALVGRRVPLDELEGLTGARPVIAALTSARLLTVSDGEVELSHEALLREWPRYKAWLEEDQVGRHLHVHLMNSAREWEATGRDPGDLYRGARLTGALEWAAQHGDELSQAEGRFLDASRRHAERSARRLRSVLAGVASLLLVALAAAAIAMVEKQRATTEARVAFARQLGAQAVTEPRLDVAMLLAREAVRLDRSPQTEGSLLATLQRSPMVIGTFALPSDDLTPPLAVSPDGRTLAASDALGLRFYDTRKHRVEEPPMTDFAGVGAPVYSSDGSLLAYPSLLTGAAGASIVVRAAHTLRLLRNLTLDPRQLAGSWPDIADGHIMIAPDARMVYGAYQEFSLGNGSFLGNGHPESTYIARWLLPSGRLLSPAPIDRAAVLAVGLTNAGTRIVVVDAQTVRILDAHSLRRLNSAAFPSALTAPAAAAISPDGSTIALTSATGRLSLIDTATGEPLTRIGPNADPVSTLAYSPDGRALAIAAANGTLTIWNPRSATPAAGLAVPGGQVQAIAFSHDARVLYTALVGGLVLEWDLTGQTGFGRQSGLSAPSSCCDPVAPLAPPLALSPDGTTFAVRLGASTVGLFSALTLQRQRSFTVTPGVGAITALAWSPTGPVLVVGGHSGLVQVWRVNGTPRLARSLSGLQTAPEPHATQAVAFSPDGRLIAATEASGSLETPTPFLGNLRDASLAIWHTGSGKLIASPQELGQGTDPFDPLAFSPRRPLLAVTTPGGGDLIINTGTGQTLRTLNPTGGQNAGSLAFSPDGTLATGTVTGIVRLWNPSSGAPVGRPLPVTVGPVSSIVFDPTGQRFAITASQDGTVKLFATPTLEQEGSTLNTDQGAASTATFAADGDTLIVVSNQGNAYTWPVSLTAWEQRACAVAGRNLTRQEWNQFLPGQTYAQVCP